jgi:hypothetical protein
VVVVDFVPYGCFLLQELIYAQKSEAVKAYLEASATQKAAKFEAARQAGVLVECLCCGDDECLEDDMVQW